MNTLFNHRSVRQFKPEPIAEPVLTKILEAATRASNTGNMQAYSIIVTRSQHLRDQLCPLHFNQTMVKTAPVHLTFCADINRFNHWCHLRDAEPGYDNFLWLYNATIDAVLASQNACLEAEHHGLGICYLGTTTYNAQKIIEVLKLPKGVVPVTAIALGYPEVLPELTDRLPLDAVIHYETYQPYSDDAINNLYAIKEQLPLTKKLIAENNTQNLAQIFTQKRYKKADNQHFSRTFLETLSHQGFMNQ